MVRLPYVTALTTLFSYGLLFAFGQMRDLFRKLIDWSKSKGKDLKVRSLIHDPLVSHPIAAVLPFLPFDLTLAVWVVIGNPVFVGKLLVFEQFVDNILIWQDCFSRPIASAPDAWIDVVERKSNDHNKTLQ
ncbi:hypothetical protein B296_00036378 [Ensete ventricosum]|uniref:Uncharacterized protein n=1 Tax=Ensete ventricosum TaxID=4639 RepID=A0A426XD25_ENSVE|nr:hypothetical protein B296_00036378 [Ensete ventricosum]